MAQIGALFAGWTKAQRIGLALALMLHAVALGILYATEYGPFGQLMALAAWALLNGLWLVLRRPASAAALSLTMLAALLVLSHFKYSILQLTVTFLDFLIVDQDTVAFLLAIFPQLRLQLLLAAIVVVPLAVLVWRCDVLRVRRSIALAVAFLAFGGIVAGARLYPEQPWEPFGGVNHLSNFARSGVTQISSLLANSWMEHDEFGHGLFEARATSGAGLAAGADDDECRPVGKPPHIIMVLDESSFDFSAAPGLKLPPGYRDYFKSADGVERTFIAEATGGPTWYSEFNVLTGLSARSFGDLKFYVTRIAAGRVKRGLPQSLQRCGYRTFSLYPTYGNFLAARSFQKSAGVGRMIDMEGMGVTEDMQPDKFYFDQAHDLLARESGNGRPLFMFVYLTANHFPWTNVYRPDLATDFKPPGNAAEVDEYLRRQHMTVGAYGDFLARLKRDYPDERFLVVRFGDHQPAISHKYLEPGVDPARVTQKVRALDPLYFATYYAIDTVNFSIADWSRVPSRIDAAYLPIVIQQAAGLPLDPTFAEQRRIMQRCSGVFYACNGGIEARRFNRALMDAGLIKGL